MRKSDENWFVRKVWLLIFVHYPFAVLGHKTEMRPWGGGVWLSRKSENNKTSTAAVPNPWERLQDGGVLVGHGMLVKRGKLQGNFKSRHFFA
ncbi:hypothetical protein AVEN_156217-1 [Araneus ventricosus]|uniref:Uncharacterized protein n=1 Tax=Araneus ventricosus TaxID=182803 RepID=A0A4Y2LUB6_ARAVE|nr:hypothetical protein AVEN_156217-1 [Araneus ventricosus]